MRFQLINVLTTLIIIPCLAAPTAKANGALDATNSNVQIRAAENTLQDAAVAEEFSLEKRAHGSHRFNFSYRFAGAQHNVGGVILPFIYRNGQLSAFITNQLHQEIAAYIKELALNMDIMALRVEPGKTVEYTLDRDTWYNGDLGEFSWRTNY